MKAKTLIFVLLSVISTTLFGQQKKIALLEPRVGEGSTGVTGMEKAMVRGELRKAIVNHTGYEAFTRADIDKLMAEQDFQRTGMVSDDQIKKIGIMSGADYICVSTLNKTNTEFYLEAYLVNVESAQISNPASQYGELNGGKLANMLPVCQALAQELLGTISPVVSSITQETVQKPSLQQKQLHNKSEQHEQKSDDTENSGQNYKIGSVKIFSDGTRGIVFYAKNGVGLVISLDNAEKKWYDVRKKEAKDIQKIENNCDDDRNFSPGLGGNYTRSIISEMGTGEAPAAEWCVNKGEGWYLPSAGELTYLFNLGKDEGTKRLIENALKREGGMSLEEGWYWSSSECEKTEAINVSSGGRASGEEKSEIEKTVAVRMFTY